MICDNQETLLHFEYDLQLNYIINNLKNYITK